MQLRIQHQEVNVLSVDYTALPEGGREVELFTDEGTFTLILNRREIVDMTTDLMYTPVPKGP